MSEPASQHIVPKFYLQYSVIEKLREEFFVDVLLNQSYDRKIYT